MKSQFRIILFLKKYVYSLKNRFRDGTCPTFRRTPRSSYKENWHCISRMNFGTQCSFSTPFELNGCFSLAEPTPPAHNREERNWKRARSPIDFELIVFGSSLMKSTTQENKEISLLLTQNIEYALSKLLN